MRTMMRRLLVALDFFVGLTACGGGVALAAGLEDFPPQWLQGTPFESYLGPGLILAIVVGGSALFAAVALLLRPALGVVASVIAGAIMMGWIAGEVAILNQPSAPTWVEVVYFAVGLAMVTLGLALRREPRAG